MLNRDEAQDGTAYTFVVNDIPVFARGTNMIIEDAVLSRCTREHRKQMIEDCVAANMNCIRVWGGAYYPEDYFFELCDEYGILVYLDCMFASIFYPTAENFVENIREELRENLLRIGTHPCLALVCGNNELEMVYTVLTSDEKETSELRKMFGSEKIEDERTKGYIWGEYSRLFLDIVPKLCQEILPQTAFVHSSPSVKVPGSAESVFDYMRDGDLHYYLAYNNCAPYEKIRTFRSRFISEMGFQSYPNWKTICAFTDEADRSPYSPVMLGHQKCVNGNQIIEFYMEQDYNVPERFEDYVYVSQVLAGEILKYSVEHFRRDRGYCMGILLWQMNDCWPTVSWAGVDYYGRWKAQQYYTKRFYQDILASAVCNDHRVSIWVTNDCQETVRANIEWQLRGVQGEIIRKEENAVILQPASSGEYADLDFSEALQEFGSSQLYFYYAVRGHEEVLSDGILLFCKAKDFAFRRPNLRIEIEEQASCFEIRLNSDTITKATELDLRTKDMKFDDNYFDLLPDREKKVRTIGKGITLEELRTELTVRSLNEVTGRGN